MNLFLKLVGSALVSAVLLVGGIFAGEKIYQPEATQSFGSFSPVQGQTYTLQGAGVTATQNTIPLASFTTPDGRAITMSMFGAIGYGTLEPNTTSKIEDITFSGITQNTNGTAILTGVTRGNDFVTPYAATPSLAKAHAGGSYFILSNTAGFYGQQFLFANNAASSTATITFSNTAPPFYYPGPGLQSTGTFNATTSEFASVAYVNGVVAAGAANATAAVKGIVQLATAVQAAAGTALGSTGASLVAPNSLFNATQSATTIVPVTNTSGKLSQLFLDLTQAFTFTATTTLSASNVLSNALILHGVPYAFPGSQGAANTALTDNGSGVLTWTVSTGKSYSLVSNTPFSASASSFATSSILTIPAGVLTASSTIQINARSMSCASSGGSTCNFYLRNAAGATMTSCGPSITANLTYVGNIEVTIGNQNSLSSQNLSGDCTLIVGTGVNSAAIIVGAVANLGNVSSIDTSQATTWALVEQAGANMIATINNYSIVVTP